MLDSNQLTGTIPSELGDLTNLTWLDLGGNQLSGSIPTELGQLANLYHLYLAGNQLIGCVPAGLRDVENSDFDQLGLPFCVTVVFGNPNWDSVQLQTEIARHMVEHGYEYATETIDGSFLSLFQGLREGDVHLLMEVQLPVLD